jgi:hypothetical protein
MIFVIPTQVGVHLCKNERFINLFIFKHSFQISLFLFWHLFNSFWIPAYAGMTHSPSLPWIRESIFAILIQWFLSFPRRWESIFVKMREFIHLFVFKHSFPVSLFLF